MLRFNRFTYHECSIVSHRFSVILPFFLGPQFSSLSATFFPLFSPCSLRFAERFSVKLGMSNFRMTVGMVNKNNSEPAEFTMTSEDFPALPGAQGGSEPLGGNSSDSKTSGQDSSTGKLTDSRGEFVSSLRVYS